MPFDSSTQKPNSGINYWYYLTLTLIALLVATGVAYVAFSFGEKSVSKSIDNVKSNSVTNPRYQNTPIGQPGINSPVLDLPNPKSSQEVVSRNEQMPSSGVISGQVFVVTKGRENIKLALVEICANREDFITGWVNSKKNSSLAKLQAAEKQMEFVQQQIRKIDTDLRLVRMNGNIHSPVGSDLELKKISLDSDLSRAIAKRDYLKSPEYFLDGMNQCEISAKSDSDGKFKIEVPSNSRYAISAVTSRKIFDSSETYWWLLWAEQGVGNQQIDLTNDTLMRGNPKNAVVRIEY
jgi:hypothetical protein